MVFEIVAHLHLKAHPFVIPGIVGVPQVVLGGIQYVCHLARGYVHQGDPAMLAGKRAPLSQHVGAIG